MRADISRRRFGWLHGLDHKRVILIAFLLRLIVASAYDVFVQVADRDPLLPDSKFYSIRGRYVDLLLQGYDTRSVPRSAIPADPASAEIFAEICRTGGGRLPSVRTEPGLFACVVGGVYFLLGFGTIWVRVLNIGFSIASAYLFFDIARRQFGVTAANLFLALALYLPTQFGYSITLSRDFLRVFAVSLVVWVIYRMGDVLWREKSS